MALFPTSEFSSSTPVSHSPSYLSESQSLKTIAISTGAQRWEIELETAWIFMAEARRVWAFLNALFGQAKTFEVALPIFSEPVGIVAGVVSVSAAYSAGDNSITFTNFTPEPGDFFTFNGHTKVYQVESAVGNVATIFPPLLQAVASNEVVTAENVLFTLRLKNDFSKVQITKRSRTQLKFKCIEAFQ